MKRQTITLLLTLLVLAGTSHPAMAQKKKDKSKTATTEEKVTVTDDESCGCELFFVDGIQTIQKDEKFGFKREDGTVIVEPTYMFVDKFHGPYCIVYRDYDHCGMIDRNGREVLPTIYTEVSYPLDGMFRVQKGNLWGFCDTAGREIIECQYRAASGFSEGVAVVLFDLDSITALYGYIDKQNNIVLPAVYEYAFPFQEGYAVVKQYDRYGMIDHAGRSMVPCKYMEVTSMTDGCFFAVDPHSGEAALFGNKFKPLTAFKYDDVKAYNEGFYVVVKDGKMTFLDCKGKECFGWHDEVGGYSDGFTYVREGDKWGIMDKKGKMILPVEYDNSGFRSKEYVFSEGLALIEKEGRYGFCDTKGRIVIPLQYQSALQCTEGLIPAKRDGMWGFIDKTGRDAIDFVFDAASFFEWGRAEVVYHNETYKINNKGQCMKNCKTFPKVKVWIDQQ